MRVLKIFGYLAAIGFIGMVAAGGLGAYGLWYYSQDLPEHASLADYQPPTATRIHAGDGRLIAEFASENRVFVPVDKMPRQVLHAFMSAEDKKFYDHPGIDPVALARAVITNVKIVLSGGGRPIGASTITQQVAKNFLLTNEVSIERKAKEAILALRIERVLSKDRIIELYLNEIYLGYGAYGVASAALNYFDKSLDELSLEEIAYLAALPKAPANYHPVRKHEAALTRRNWVIGRMLEDGRITQEEADTARAAPLAVKTLQAATPVNAQYFVEETRRVLADKVGLSSVNEGGLSVRTSLDPRLQEIARSSLRTGLIAYDRRHGYRGPIAEIDISEDWFAALIAVDDPLDIAPWQIAVVLSTEAKQVEIGLKDGETGTIPFREMTWAREALKDQTRGEALKRPSDALSPGDVVLVEPVQSYTPSKEGAKPIDYPEGTFGLRQVPNANGGVVALDPHTGRILAMQGGWSFQLSEFNRATQARRQPGSSIKPFVYLAALERDYTPASLILDAPFVMDQGPGQKKWKPANFSRKFYGPSPMRLGIERSRNLMTVRLAQAIGMDAVAETVESFGITENLPRQLSMSLGAGETTLLDMTAAYAMLVNGGKRITPSVIDRVQDRNGITVFRHDARACEGCAVAYWDPEAPLQPPVPPDEREALTDPVSAFLVTNMLEGVVQRGSGRRIRDLGIPLAGKTGTSNDSRDTWFIGFAPDLAVGVFVGFDAPLTLGKQPSGFQETGSSVAAPIFKEFMRGAFEEMDSTPFRTPAGVRLVRIDADKGGLATASSERIIQEAFRAGTEPKRGKIEVVLDGSDGSGASTAQQGSASQGPILQAPVVQAPVVQAPSVQATPSQQTSQNSANGQADNAQAGNAQAGVTSGSAIPVPPAVSLPQSNSGGAKASRGLY